MAPFDAGFIQDETLQAQIGQQLIGLDQGKLAVASAHNRFDAMAYGMQADAAELDEMLTAPAMRKLPTFEAILQNLDAHGTLTTLVFVGVYLLLMHAT
ncbi:MAG: hypothetical protein P4L66_12150 [Acetobacteraceae bacterium]|nr:hypothetical protein [Acetobacteraceae bacterium]